MRLHELVEKKRLGWVSESITMIELRSTIERLFRLHRLDLIGDDATLLLISGYIKKYEEAQGVKG